MYSVENRTALVTGANSGLGFETAALLAESGYGKVVVTARTQSKADEARRRLVERTDKDVFVTSVMDFDSLATIEPAVADLTADESKFDVLMLNAGIAPPSDARFTKDGLEATMAASLVGHHLLTMRLLEQGIVNENARIVIAGSEAARGDVPMFRPIGIDEFAKEEFDGDLDSAIESVMRLTGPATYKSPAISMRLQSNLWPGGPPSSAQTGASRHHRECRLSWLDTRNQCGSTCEFCDEVPHDAYFEDHPGDVPFDR